MTKGMVEAVRARKKSGPGEERVLVVDPRDEELERTSETLRLRGFKVASLSRPEASVTLYDVFRPDAVVIAVEPQHYAGLTVARQIRQRSGGTLPLFFLVDEPTAEIRRRCLEKGQAVDVLTAPLDGAELAARIRSQLVLRDAVERATRAAGELRAPTLHDGVTGVYNRRFLLALTAQEMRRCERYGGSFSLVACRVKGFTRFRKEFGRELSDRLLVYNSMVLTQTVRESDVVARVGEAEFALLLPGAPLEQLHHFLERLQARFQLARFQVDGKPVRPQVALGSASFPDVVGTAKHLLMTALQDSRRPRGLYRGDVSMLVL